MRSSHRPTSLLILTVALASLAWARPLDTDDTGTVRPGAWELEGGIDFRRASGVESWALTPVAAYGLGPATQLDLACDYLVEVGAHGPDEIHAVRPGLQLKQRLSDTAPGGFALGLKINLGWPDQLRGPGVGLQRDGHVRVLATRAVGAVEFDLNAGYDFTGSWGGGDDAWMASAGFRWGGGERWDLVGELVAMRPDGGRTQTLVALGARRAASRGWTWDALVGTGIGPERADLRIIVGFVRSL